MTTLVLALPVGLSDKAALLAAYGAALEAPWSPGTWDGLYDLLQGLWWLPPGDVTIRLEDEPLAGTREGETHALVLEDSVRAWAERRPGPAHRVLRVVRP